MKSKRKAEFEMYLPSKIKFFITLKGVLGFWGFGVLGEGVGVIIRNTAYVA